MNKPIRALEDKLIEDLNAAKDVEIEAKRLILTNLLNLVKVQADATILAEMNEEKHE